LRISTSKSSAATPRRSAAIATLESRINPIQAREAGLDDC
jgi:hypothetical protein